MKTSVDTKKVSDIATTFYYDDGNQLVKVSAVIKGNDKTKVTDEVNLERI